jgi:hypothetical protein
LFVEEFFFLLDILGSSSEDAVAVKDNRWLTFSKKTDVFHNFNFPFK